MDKKVKLFFVINSLGRGGAEGIVLNLAKNLDKNKFAVTIVYFVNKKITANHDIDSLPGVQLKPILVEKILSWSTFFSLLNYFKKVKPDILHCHLPVSVILGVIAGKLAGVKKIIVHEHNTYNFYSFKIRACLKILRPLVDLSICYSESVQKEIFDRINVLDDVPKSLKFGDCTIHNGIDEDTIFSQVSSIDKSVERNALGLKSDDLVVISVSRLLDWKGQDILIKAFESVVKKIPSAKLLIVGRGEKEGDLKKLSSQLGLEKNIIFLGERQDIVRLLAVSDIFSFVLKYPPNFSSEAIGVSALEAMAAGLPIILAKYPSIPDFMVDQQNVLLVDPNNDEALSRAIISLAVDQDLRNKLKNGSRHIVQEHYSLHRIIRIYEYIYLNIL